MIQTNETRYTGHGARIEDDPIAQLIRARAVLAPMSGVTDVPFRLMARKFGCAFAFTEMIDVNGIVYNNRKTYSLFSTTEEDFPLAVQLVGADAGKLVHAAEVCQEKGYKMLDINAGCPAGKVVKCGKGAALMNDPGKLGTIIRVLVKTLTIPVTVKIRSGWDENSLNYLEIAKRVAGEGASAVCIHPRTRQQMYKGEVDLEVIREVKEALDVPVFASGNLFTPKDVTGVFQNTGCDAVFIARGSLGRPWIFREINSCINNSSDYDTPGFDEIKKYIVEHYSLCLRFYDERMTKKRMYKHLSWYLKKLKNLNIIMEEYRKVTDFSSFKCFMSRIRLDGRKRLCLDVGSPGSRRLPASDIE